MSNRTRSERRRLIQKAEARRLSRFHRDLEGGLPPKAIVGPVERLWRERKITAELFWVATRFASCFEATLPDSLLRAGSGECVVDGKWNGDAVDAIGRLRLGQKYQDAVVALDLYELELHLDRGLATVMLAAAVHKIALEEIDGKLKKRKGWSRLQLMKALVILVDLWHSEIERARTRAEANGSTLV